MFPLFCKIFSTWGKKSKFPTIFKVQFLILVSLLLELKLLSESSRWKILNKNSLPANFLSKQVNNFLSSINTRQSEIFTTSVLIASPIVGKLTLKVPLICAPELSSRTFVPDACMPSQGSAGLSLDTSFYADSYWCLTSDVWKRTQTFSV